MPWISLGVIISYYLLMGCSTLLHTHCTVVQYNEILYMIMDLVNTRDQTEIVLEGLM